MSNTRKPAAKQHSLARYRAEAKGEPFTLWLDDDETIVIPRPKGSVMFGLEEATSSRQIIRLLAGDQADRLLEVFAEEDFAVMQAVSNDMQEHFGLGEQQG